MEVINERPPIGGFRVAIFDFDGTLSLLRRNWHEIMIPMMVEVLSGLPASENLERLHVVVEEFVMRLNGRQTIYQMIQLAEEVMSRGGEPADPLEYKRRYHDLLWVEVSRRVAAVKRGDAPAESFTVPGAYVLLDRLFQQDVLLYLASGTDLNYVRDELEVLGLAKYFGDRVHGALDDYKKFSKAKVVRQIFEETGFAAEQLVGFGDGFVEIEEVRKAGGFAVGVASNEDTREGVNEWKRQRLRSAGADVILGDYRAIDELMGLLRLS
jgi:phosphoglycolate phosphatase-like HAD superfamily hydrolase